MTTKAKKSINSSSKTVVLYNLSNFIIHHQKSLVSLRDNSLTLSRAFTPTSGVQTVSYLRNLKRSITHISNATSVLKHLSQNARHSILSTRRRGTRTRGTSPRHACLCHARPRCACVCRASSILHQN